MTLWLSGSATEGNIAKKNRPQISAGGSFLLTLN